MATRKSKEQMGTFEQIIMSMPAPDRSLIIDKIFRFVVLDKKSLAEKLHTENLRIEKLGAKKLRTKKLRTEKLRTEKLRTKKPVTRKRRATVKA